MRCFVPSLRSFLGLPSLFLFAALSAFGQDHPSSEQAPAEKPPAAKIPNGPAAPIPTIAKPPALVDPNGPAISLLTSESLFDFAVALNECGYDQGLQNSDPLRQHIRDEVNQYLQGSAEARDARDKVCGYIEQHRMANAGRDLAQYVSLALYTTPPPNLAPSVELPDLPPDSTQVVEVLPLLRAFVKATDLHAIWAANRGAYEDEVAKLHDPLTKMIPGDEHLPEDAGERL